MSNFRTIYDKVNKTLSQKLLRDEESAGKHIREFHRFVADDEVLKRQFIIYENLLNAECDEGIVDDFIRKNMQFVSDLNYYDIQNTNRIFEAKFRNLMSRGKMDGDQTKLFASIHYLIKFATTQEAMDLKETSFSHRKVRAHLLQEKDVDEFDRVLKKESKIKDLRFLDKSIVLRFAVKRFNKKYESLSEDEKKLLQLISEKQDIHQYASDLRAEVLRLIDEHLEGEVEDEIHENLLVVKDRLANKEVTLDEVMKLLHLKTMLEKQ